ncbi:MULTISPECIES: DUF397 domain-containing protein [unclassified Streptomyces]|uniref:DUF397 domain-containing protein n=1 Tax=unclassified Streptomyces TaxID=2593676 RepID=UPI0036ABFA9B
MSTEAVSPGGPVWVRSSYSAGNGGDCVEVATTPVSVRIRDSKRPDGPVLAVGPDQWAAFVRMSARG